jgi:hypothetical protein
MRISELEEAQQTGTYVGVNFSEETIRNLAAYQKTHNIPNPTPADKLHTTILYSRRHVDWRPKTDLALLVSPEHSDITVFNGRDGSRCLVWKYQSEYLTKRFDLGRALGATFDYDSYKPHITLSYDIGNFDFASLPVPDFNIEIVGEYAEPLEQDWQEKAA